VIQKAMSFNLNRWILSRNSSVKQKFEQSLGSLEDVL
jgi:hypothetical protein